MTTFNILAKRNNLTITESGAIKINPHSKYEFTTYPINEELKTIEVSQDEYLGLMLKVYQFNEALDAVEPFNVPQFNELRAARFMALKAAREAKAVENESSN